MHGDFGHDNLLIDDGTVSAVLDWGEARYGDPLHDVAWLNVWDVDIDYGQAVREHYATIGKTVPHYDERLELHTLAIVAGGLSFVAGRRSESEYRKHQESIKEMVDG